MGRIKKLFLLLVLTLSGYTIFKFIKKLSEYFSLNKSLPEYLFDVTGVKPVVKTQFSKLCVNIEVGYPESLIAKEKNLYDIITSYIADYYPALYSLKKSIKIYSTDY